MMTKMTVARTIALLSFTVVTAQAQTAAVNTTSAQTAPHKHRKAPKEPSLQVQLKEMRDQLQAQIDDLKTNMANKDAQIAALQAKVQRVEESAGTATAQVHSVENNVHENTAAVAGLQASVSSTQTVTSAQGSEIATVRKTEEIVKKEVEEPRTIRYKRYRDHARWFRRR